MFASLRNGWAKVVSLQPKALPAPEPFVTKPRPAVGLLSQLSAEQKKLLYAHTGPVSQGDAAFKRKPKAS